MEYLTTKEAANEWGLRRGESLFYAPKTVLTELNSWAKCG